MRSSDNLLPLEDTSSDVLAKALSHAGISNCCLPASEEDWPTFLRLRLHLDPDSFFAMPDAIPAIRLPSGLKRHILPFGDWSLNIWTIQTPEGTVAIDTGLSRDQLREASQGIPPVATLITHFHRDHVGGIEAYPNSLVLDPANTRPGNKAIRVAGLNWTVLDLAGHTPDGIGWFTTWQGCPIFFPGDSIFACSIGKCEGSEQLAMTNILNAMNALPPKTIICPGHGPATTVALEWKRNPFISLFRQS